MSTLGRLFGKSPFTPLQTHMAKVTECVRKSKELFILLEAKDYNGIAKLAKKISKLEHAADLTKIELRNNLPRGIFLPVHRSNILEVLTLQDSLADKAEDIGILLTFRNIILYPEIREAFSAFLSKNYEAFEGVWKVIDQIDELVEFSFSGLEAVKVNEMVEEVAYAEYEADKLQRTLMKILYNMDTKKVAIAEFILIIQLVQEIAQLSNLSEKLAYRVRMMLEIK